MEEGITNTAPSADKELWKLAVELWKIEKKLQKCKEKLSEEDNKSFEFLFNRVNQIFWSNNVKVTDFSNQKWNEWMSLLDIVSVEEDEWLEFPVIWETITPLVEVNWNVVQRSKVIIYKPKEKEIVKLMSSKKTLRLCLAFLLVIILLIIWVSLLFHRNSNNGELDVKMEEQNISEDSELTHEDNIIENTEEINDESQENVSNEDNIENIKHNIENTGKNIEEIGEKIEEALIEEGNFNDDTIQDNWESLLIW